MKKNTFFLTRNRTGFYAFQFNHHPDFQGVLKKSYWYFDNHLLMCNRLPIKDNLFKRDIISFNDCLCSSGCGMSEDMDHLFLRYNFFNSLWSLVAKWWCRNSRKQYYLWTYFAFYWSFGFSKSEWMFLTMVWYRIIWTIWKEQNGRII